MYFKEIMTEDVNMEQTGKPSEVKFTSDIKMS